MFWRLKGSGLDADRRTCHGTLCLSNATYLGVFAGLLALRSRLVALLHRSSILTINLVGYFRGHYSQQFDLDDDQRTPILQTNYLLLLARRRPEHVFASSKGLPTYVDAYTLRMW